MKKNIHIIGVPSDLGANIRGSAMGPEAIRIANLTSRIKKLGYDVLDKGNIPVPIRETLNSDDYLHPITKICSLLAQETANSYSSNSIPIILGGDHSISIGSVSGISSQTQNLGLLWVDTHGDLNTPKTSQTQNIHGMPLASLIGLGHSELTTILHNETKVKPKNTVLLGIRSIDNGESEILKKSGITYFTMKDIDEQGISSIINQTLSILNNTSDIHVSFDLDVLDPLQMSSVSTPVSGGLNIREAHSILEAVAKTDKLSSLDIVELNPFIGKTANDATIAVDLILSALGKSII